MQNSQEFRAGTNHAVPGILWHGSYRTHRNSGYWYGSLTEHPEVPGIVARAYRTYRSSGYGYKYPRELTEVPGTGNTRVNTRPRRWGSI